MTAITFLLHPEKFTWPTFIWPQPIYHPLSLKPLLYQITLFLRSSLFPSIWLHVCRCAPIQQILYWFSVKKIFIIIFFCFVYFYVFVSSSFSTPSNMPNVFLCRGKSFMLPIINFVLWNISLFELRSKWIFYVHRRALKLEAPKRTVWTLRVRTKA